MCADCGSATVVDQVTMPTVGILALVDDVGANVQSTEVAEPPFPLDPPFPLGPPPLEFPPVPAAQSPLLEEQPRANEHTQLAQASTVKTRTIGLLVIPADRAEKTLGSSL